MAARQVRGARGFTLLEMMTVVAVTGVLIALAAGSITSATRVSRVAGEARLIVQRLQSARTAAVAQGAARGYLVGPNGPGPTDPNANRAIVFAKLGAPGGLATVTYANGVDRVKDVDPLPVAGPGGTNAAIEVAGPGLTPLTAFSVGFDLNGRPTVSSYDAAYTAAVVPFGQPGNAPTSGANDYFCIRVRDVVDLAVARYVVLFNDGSVKVQRDETYCP